MKQPLLSIIMAVRDTADYLPACLDSIIDQTYSNWELITANDHSTDDTPRILAQYAKKDSRIRVINSIREKLIPTLKEAYPHAKGTLINRMDSDDIMPKDKLEVMVLEWLKHGKGTIIAGGTEHFVEKGEVGKGFIRYEQWLNHISRHSLHWQEIYKECVIPSHCWLIHRDDFESAGGFEREVYPEDYDLCFRFYKQKLKVIGLDKILHYWRDRSNRISRTWEEYEDNRYYELKVSYFYELDRNTNRPLVLWGAGKNGKDLAKHLLKREQDFTWVCDNSKKIGLDIYGIRMNHFESIAHLKQPQIIMAIASPTDQREIYEQLERWGKQPVIDYWFF